MAFADPVNPADVLSRAFEECFQAVLRELEPFLHVR